MALGPASQAILDQLNATAPDMTAIGPLEFRAYSAAMVQPADPADRVLATDVDADGVPVRMYRRAEAIGPEPCVVFYHGGGYIACGIESHDRLCHRLARLANCAIASVDYRLAPEHAFPAAVDDAFAALRWVAANAQGLGVDAARLAVGGDSAGGSLATVAAVRARDEGGPALVHQLLIYPGTDLANASESRRAFGKGYFLDDDFSELCVSAYLPNAADRAHPWASPLLADDLSRLPPATILTAECDPLRDEGAAYAERLRGAGVPVAHTVYPGVFHGFVSMFGLVPEADQALDEAATALAHAFAVKEAV